MKSTLTKIQLIIMSRKPHWTGHIAIMFLILCIGFGLLIYKSKLSLKKKIISAVLFFYSYNLLVITLLMRPTQKEKSINLLPFFLSEYAKSNRGGWDWFFNILLFVPLGFLLFCLINSKKRYVYTLLIGFWTTLFIELTQYFARLGSLELDDIFANTLGTAVGIGIFIIAKKYVKSRKQKS